MFKSTRTKVILGVIGFLVIVIAGLGIYGYSTGKLKGFAATTNATISGTITLQPGNLSYMKVTLQGPTGISQVAATSGKYSFTVPSGKYYTLKVAPNTDIPPVQPDAQYARFYFLQHGPFLLPAKGYTYNIKTFQKPYVKGRIGLYINGQFFRGVPNERIALADDLPPSPTGGISYKISSVATTDSQGYYVMTGLINNIANGYGFMMLITVGDGVKPGDIISQSASKELTPNFDISLPGVTKDNTP